MLRVFHTADWHLGHLFHGFDRDWEHTAFLEWFLEKIAGQKPDALLIAGDVFDSVNPPAVAQRRFYDFLARAHEAQPAMQVVIIAGNHDAALRLEAPRELLRGLNISVVGTPARHEQGEIDYDRFIVPLHDGSGTVHAVVAAVPFLRPHDVPEVKGAQDAYMDGVRELYRRAFEAARTAAKAWPGAALLAMGHCHLPDAAESRDSERRIVIGAAEALPADTFPDDVAYVALGHLHKAQELHGGRIRYSGSPIPLSFSEHAYEHRVLELILEGNQVASVAALPIPRQTALLRLPAGGPAPLAEVLLAIEALPADADLPDERKPYLEVRVLDEGPDPGRRRSIEQALAGKSVRLASIKAERARGTGAETADVIGLPALADLSAMDPVEILTEAHRLKHGGAEPAPALLAAFREILAAEAGNGGAAA